MKLRFGEEWVEQMQALEGPISQGGVVAEQRDAKELARELIRQRIGDRFHQVQLVALAAGQQTVEQLLSPNSRLLDVRRHKRTSQQAAEESVIRPVELR